MKKCVQEWILLLNLFYKIYCKTQYLKIMESKPLKTSFTNFGETRKQSKIIEFYWYVSQDGSRRQANVQPDYFKNGKIIHLGKKGHFNHFLCHFPNETPSIFIGKLFK